MTDSADLLHKHSFVELGARQRAKALLDAGTFRELLDPFQRIMSPWLSRQGVVPQADDGVVIAKGSIGGMPVVIAAIEGAFQGGSLGEVGGAKIAGALEQITVDQMDASWRVNVRSHFVAAQAAMPLMRAQGKGSIIITSSNSGVQYDREMIAYATTKHAVIAMTRQIAVDYARYNVRCNALCPGFVDTDFNAGFERQMGGRGSLERYVATAIPMGRWGTPDEIAQSIVFLASDQSSFMTGHALVIDGAESL